MSDDELLREASDPATPGERLRAIALSERMQRPWQSDEERRHIEAVSEALAANPSLPLDLLGPALLGGGDMRLWLNPAVPLLLLQQPAPEYREAARVLLVTLAHGRLDLPLTPTLEAAVAAWASVPRSRLDHRLGPGGRERQDLARHLAALFGLPWEAGAGPPRR